MIRGRDEGGRGKSVKVAFHKLMYRATCLATFGRKRSPKVIFLSKQSKRLCAPLSPGDAGDGPAMYCEKISTTELHYDGQLEIGRRKGTPKNNLAQNNKLQLGLH